MTDIFKNSYCEAHYEPEDLCVITVHAFGKTFTSYYPECWDSLDTITVDKDGDVNVASYGGVPICCESSGSWYSGDESWHIGCMSLSGSEWTTMKEVLHQTSRGVYEVLS